MKVSVFSENTDFESHQNGAETEQNVYLLRAI